MPSKKVSRDLKQIAFRRIHVTDSLPSLENSNERVLADVLCLVRCGTEKDDSADEVRI
jgi:hypothetical protein